MASSDAIGAEEMAIDRAVSQTAAGLGTRVGPPAKVAPIPGDHQLQSAAQEPSKRSGRTAQGLPHLSRCSRSKLASWAKRGLTSASTCHEETSRAMGCPSRATN